MKKYVMFWNVNYNHKLKHRTRGFSELRISDIHYHCDYMKRRNYDNKVFPVYVLDGDDVIMRVRMK